MGMKRLLALALALCLCLSILPGAAWETTSGSHISWSFDKASGRLTISGSGGCEVFESAEDQPWAALRTEIREVWFYDQADLSIENLAYWFTDCINLYFNYIGRFENEVTQLAEPTEQEIRQMREEIEEAKKEKSRAYHRQYSREYRAPNLEKQREYDRIKAREYRARRKAQAAAAPAQ